MIARVGNKSLIVEFFRPCDINLYQVAISVDYMVFFWKLNDNKALFDIPLILDDLNYAKMCGLLKNFLFKMVFRYC